VVDLCLFQRRRALSQMCDERLPVSVEAKPRTCGRDCPRAERLLLGWPNLRGIGAFSGGTGVSPVSYGGMDLVGLASRQSARESGTGNWKHSKSRAANPGAKCALGSQGCSATWVYRRHHLRLNRPTGWTFGRGRFCAHSPPGQCGMQPKGEVAGRSGPVKRCHPPAQVASKHRYRARGGCAVVAVGQHPGVGIDRHAPASHCPPGGLAMQSKMELTRSARPTASDASCGPGLRANQATRRTSCD
jgi:hypothetical protein